MKPELMALLLGILVSIFAVIVSIAKKYVFRKEQRISVCPFLQIIKSTEINQPLKIILQNTGRGSAFINSVEIKADGIPIHTDKKSSLYNALAKIGLNGFDVLHYNLAEHDEIKPERKYVLLESNPINEIERAKIQTALARLSFKINYESLYGEIFSLVQ